MMKVGYQSGSCICSKLKEYVMSKISDFSIAAMVLQIFRALRTTIKLESSMWSETSARTSSFLEVAGKR